MRESPSGVARVALAERGTRRDARARPASRPARRRPASAPHQAECVQNMVQRRDDAYDVEHPQSSTRARRTRAWAPRRGACGARIHPRGTRRSATSSRRPRPRRPRNRRSSFAIRPRSPRRRRFERETFSSPDAAPGLVAWRPIPPEGSPSFADGARRGSAPPFGSSRIAPRRARRPPTVEAAPRARLDLREHGITGRAARVTPRTDGRSCR